MDRREMKAFNASVLKELYSRSTQRGDVQALRAAIERADLDATVFWLFWVCGDQADWLQEMLFGKGVNVGRMKSHPSRRRNSAAAHVDLFTWLAPKAAQLRQVEPFSLKKDSTRARAKSVLGYLKREELRMWQKEDKKRERWNLANLSTEDMIGKFAAFLKMYESDQRVIRRQRIRDYRLKGRDKPAPKRHEPNAQKRARIPNPIMLEVLRRQHAEALKPSRKPRGD